jgi:hypothetical protein
MLDWFSVTVSEAEDVAELSPQLESNRQIDNAYNSWMA